MRTLEWGATKQAATDAFKRAAVRFGIAHELYAYGVNWVELDGDAKNAKPLEDPAVVYARRTGGTVLRVAEGSGSAHQQSAAAAQSRPALALDEEQCPKCGGRMWDNRLTKRNPRAPDFKCRDRSCDGVVWPSKSGEQKPAEVASAGSKKPTAPAADWPPLNGAPLVPEADLPF